MSKQSKSGRISPKTRVAIVEAVREFSTSNSIPFNTVMSAVLWAGTKTSQRMCPATLKALITTETVTAYQAEVTRRETDYVKQVEGIIRNALPADQRTDERITELFDSRPVSGVSLKALRVWVEQQVADEATA